MEINPDNIEAYSSLSVSYKKQGDKYMNAKNWDSAKDCYEKCCKAVKDGAARVNANRGSLQEDLTIKSSLYYNAGQARDALGDIYKSKNDYGTAIRNYDLAAKNYQTAIDNATMMEMDDSVISIYQNAKSKSLSKKSDLQKKEKQASVKQKKVKVKTAVGKTKNKKAAFTMATIKLKNTHSVVGVIDTSHEYNA
jgi:tetratricopeptide (TPR) repeat protein